MRRTSYNLVKATAHTKVLVFTTNITSLVLFIGAGRWSGVSVCVWRKAN